MTTLSPDLASLPTRTARQRTPPKTLPLHVHLSTCRDAHPGVLARLAALPSLAMLELQKLWRDLNDGEAPRMNRKFIESRLACRIQELAYGGLKQETRARLAALADDLAAGSKAARRSGASETKLLSGTRLIREWQGEEHTVTDSGFEWQGMPYASLSSVARAITGTRWNGPLFFGLRSTKVVVQHDADDIGKLPAFPAGAD